MLSQLRRRPAGSSRRIQTGSADRMPAADPERALDAMPAIEQTMLFTVRWIFAADPETLRSLHGTFSQYYP